MLGSKHFLQYAMFNFETSMTFLFFFFSGLSILEKYEADLAKIVAEQQELFNAEKLLGMSVSVYPEVTRIQKVMSGLREIYAIYKAQKVGQYCCQ